VPLIHTYASRRIENFKEYPYTMAIGMLHLTRRDITRWK
jgi:hypothetical protein